MKQALTLAWLAAAVAVAGCATVSSGRFSNPMTFSDTDPTVIEHVARRTLLELRFDTEYPEASKGRLATDSLTGASWFEFWRLDTVGAMQSLESSIHTIRRRATVNISPKDGGAQLSVKVVKERKSAPGAGPRTIAESYNLYSPEDTDLMRQNELAPTDYEWVGLGRDELLEQSILERILANLK